MNVRFIMSRLWLLARSPRWKRRALQARWVEHNARFLDDQRSHYELVAAQAAARSLEVEPIAGGAGASEVRNRAVIECMTAFQFSQRLSEDAGVALALADELRRDARVEFEIVEYRRERRERGLQTRFPWLAGQPKTLARRNEAVLSLAQDWFDLLRAVLPRTVADEELGDELEMMAALLKNGSPGWLAMIKLVSATIVVLVNTGRFMVGRGK